MSHKNHCQACTFMKHGVKTRQAIRHTCGQSWEQIKQMMETHKIQQEQMDAESEYFDLLMRLSNIVKTKGMEEALRLYPEHKKILDKINGQATNTSAEGTE